MSSFPLDIQGILAQNPSLKAFHDNNPTVFQQVYNQNLQNHGFQQLQLPSPDLLRQALQNLPTGEPSQLPPSDLLRQPLTARHPTARSTDVLSTPPPTPVGERKRTPRAPTRPHHSVLSDDDIPLVVGGRQAKKPVSTTPDHSVLSDDDDIPLIGGGRKAFTVEEDERLCKTWISISEDSVVGTNQKEGQFWGRIERVYNSGAAEKRTKKALQNRWGPYISKPVNKFAGLYSRAVNRIPTGEDNNWAVKEAGRKYYLSEGSVFNQLHSWHILKDCPK